MPRASRSCSSALPAAGTAPRRRLWWRIGSVLQCVQSTNCWPPTARWRGFGPRVTPSRAPERIIDSGVPMKDKIYPVPETFAATARVQRADSERMYRESIDEPNRFWAEIGQRLDWIREFSVVKDTSYDPESFHIRWFSGGKLNVSANCLDRHLELRGDKTAIIWEGDDPNQSEHISYRRLYERVCQCANALKSLGVGKGDRVTIYLPMIPEIAVAMLACARIGAIHSVVFAGFSSEALGGRIADCDSRLVITADEGLRGGKRVPLKQTVDGALTIAGTECVQNVLVVRRTGADVAMKASRDRWY